MVGNELIVPIMLEIVLKKFNNYSAMPSSKSVFLSGGSYLTKGRFSKLCIILFLKERERDKLVNFIYCNYFYIFKNNFNKK